MKIALSVLVASVLVFASASAGSSCVGLSKEQTDKLKTLIVTEDPHDKLVGTFTQTHGPQHMKDFAELDEDTCFEFERTKVDENKLSKPEVHGEKLLLPAKNLEKISMGVYMKTKIADEKLDEEATNADKEMFILYASDNVVAYAECFATFTPQAPIIPFYPIIEVHKSALKTPMDEAVQTQINEAVKIIKENEDLMGSLIEYPRCK